MKQILLSLIMVFAYTSAMAATVSRTVHLKNKGTLRDSITATDIKTITNFTITGELNGRDIVVLREMAGRKTSGAASTGVLAKLDMSGATIVKDKTNYYYYDDNYDIKYYTQSNEIGEYMFHNCRSLIALKLPENTTKICDQGLTLTNIISLVIPKSVTEIEGRALPNLIEFTMLNRKAKLHLNSYTGTMLTTARIETPCPPATCPFHNKIDPDATLYVPKEALEAYKADYEWGFFPNIEPIDYNYVKREVYVEEAGTLNELISQEDKFNINELTVSGQLNGDDISFIRDMAQFSYGELLSLNLYDANIVRGGQPYYGAFTTEINTVSNYMFSGLTLRYLTLPRSIKTIGMNNESLKYPTVFDNVNLLHLTVGDQVRTLNNPFDLPNLKTLTIQASTPPKCEFTTALVNNCTLYVPNGSKKLYQDAYEWKRFLNIVETDMPGITTLLDQSHFYNESLIKVNGCQIQVNKNINDLLTVYSSQGKQIYKGKNNKIILPIAGLYLVNIDSKTYKVFVE